MASMWMASGVSVGSSAAKAKTARVNEKNKPMGRSNFIWRAQLNKMSTDLPSWICRDRSFTHSDEHDRREWRRLLALAEFNFVPKQVEKIGELKSRPFLGV